MQQIIGAFSKYGIRIDPQILALNQNKENAISQIITLLESALARDKDFQNTRVYNFIRCILLNALAQEVNAHYFKSIEMKQLLHDLRELILKMANDNFERQLRIAENERINEVRHKHKAEHPLFPPQHHKYNLSSIRLLTEIKLKIEELEIRKKEIENEMEKRKRHCGSGIRS